MAKSYGLMVGKSNTWTFDFGMFEPNIRFLMGGKLQTNLKW